VPLQALVPAALPVLPEAARQLARAPVRQQRAYAPVLAPQVLEQRVAARRVQPERA
jgi:hypothetical protein